MISRLLGTSDFPDPGDLSRLLGALDIKNAFLQANGFDREVYLRAPCERNSKDTRRVWQLRAPAYGSNDAPAAFRRSLRKYPANPAESLSSVGLHFKASPFDPCVHFVYQKSGSAVGVNVTHIDDIPGPGEPDLSLKARSFLETRFGKLEVREGSFVHVGMELAQEKDSL